jgi:hypothetical protein
MGTETASWVRTHSFGGRVVGEFISEDAAVRRMAVIQTLSGPEIAPSDALIPLDQAEVIGSLAQRVEDLLDAAERVGYSPDEMRAAVEQALQRKGV